jgi:protease-4
MSPETREVLTGILDELYSNLVQRIATARQKTPEQVKAIIDDGPFTAAQALKAGLVDDLKYADEAWGALKDRLKSGEPAKVSLDKYMKVPPEDAGLKGTKRVALIVGQGDIVRGSPSDDGSEEGMLTAYGFNRILKQVGSDPLVQAVVVRIDSPGGEVTASDDIWREMNLLSKKKPLVISMADVAASGGYYMAMTGDPIVAYPLTQTGSIGVVFGKPNIHGLYDKLGISKDAIQRGKNAAIDSDYTPLTPDERRKLKEGIDSAYVSFVTKVATARKRPYAEIEPSAQGRVWLGSQARSHGLVDELGGLDRAVELAKKKANIPEAEQVRLVSYPARRSLIEVLLQRKPQEEMLQSRVAQILGRVPFRAWMKGGFLRLMPYWVEVR